MAYRALIRIEIDSVDKINVLGIFLNHLYKDIEKDSNLDTLLADIVFHVCC